MADVNANIGINFDTSQALAQLRQLQAGLSRFNQTLTQGNVAAMNAQKGLNSQLMQAINATGKFVATQKEIATSTSSFTQALEKNQLSMRQYFRYTAAAATQNTKVFKGMFAQERETLTRASKDRVKLLQSQYIQMQAANGNMIKVLQVIPKHLKMVNGQYTDYATRMQMAAQRQQFLNQLLKQGSTQLLNFGKNTQWAGRQLMVGLTIPLSILGSTAAKTFMEMEQAVLKFTRVYGDMTTSGDATNKAVADIQRLGKEFTKYGIAVKDTVEMAATAAAMGLTGEALTSQVIAATKLAVLGQVEQQQALETTISLQNAFGISSEQLAQKINFLNAVENQTVLSIEDLTVAIPKAGPVVKQLGGSVEDLAFFMTAMKEGGINASEGANALKSGLASMINPAKKTSEFLASLGINIKGIVNANAGDLKGTVVGFARALDTLDPLNRARAIEQLFGKFQFARLSTLFQNVTKDSSQAARALGLAGASVEELAILSERELAKVEDSTGAKFKKAMENLKNELVPVGKAFLQAVTPIVSFVGRVLEKFNTLSDGTKKVITVIIGVVAGLAPVLLMTFGVFMNFVANAIKLFAKLRGGVAQLNGSNNVLGGGFEYLTNQQIENLAETNALHTSHNQLISTFNVEAASVQALAAAYGTAASQARALAQSSPGLFNTVPGPAGAVAGLPPTKFATGGVVPGTGNKDTVPALLTPGEVVITKQTAKENPELVAALQNGSVNRYHKGTGEVHKHPHPKKPKYTITEPHTGRVAGGEQNTKTMSGGAIMMPGNIQGRPVAGSTVAGGDSRFIAKTQLNDDGELIPTGATDSFKAATAGSMKTQMQALDGIKRQTDESFAIWSESNKHLSPHFDEMANIFAKEIVPGVTDVSQAGQNAYPKMVAYIDSLERDLKITAAEAEKMKIAARRIFDADLGTPENPGKDAVAMNRKRVETGIDADGNERITDIRTERVALPGHSMSEYLDGKTKENTDREYALRGLTPPEETDEKGSKPTFAHIKSGEAGPSYLDPIASEKGGVTDTERAIVEKLRNRERLSAGQIITPAPTVEVPPEDIATAEAAGAKVGQAVIDGAEGPEGVDKGSPSRKGRKIGKSVADGIVEGLQEGTPEVTAQSSRLGDASVPTEAETRAKVDKMDLANKSFYDDINSPELRDERQILKSQDRQRRKRAKEAGIGRGPGTPPESGPSSLTVTSTARTEAAADQLAVSTEQAATAQAQVVQQIHDESKSRVTIKGNTINIGKARQEADRLDKEASDAEAAAAKVRTEAAKWEEVAAREGGKNMHTAENAKALKKLADEAEIKAAEARIKAAEAQRLAAEEEAKTVVISDEDVKTPGKIQKIKEDAQEEVANGTQEQGDGLRRIVDGTDETADSTLLVAEQTDELASVTGEAVDAQTETAGNLLTGAQITNATTGNMNDVLQSTDMTGVAQDNIAESSKNIANTNELIEAEKKKELDRLKRYNAEQAAAQAAENGIIPAGAQSQNTMINPETAMGSVEAYEEASTYTRDKNGQILFDPELDANGKKQPTTLSEKQIRKKKRGMRKEKVGKVSGKLSGGLGTAAMVAGMAGAPPAVTAGLGAVATVAQFAPMLAGLTGPQGIVLALAAVAVGAYALNKKLEGSAIAIAKFTRSTTVGSDMLKKIGEQTGKVGASELMNKRRGEGQLNTYVEVNRKSTMESAQFLEGEAGKALQNSFVANATKNGTAVAAQQFALQIAAAISDGTIAPELGQDIATQMGINLKDSVTGVRITAELRKLVGPNGEDLAKNPLEVRARIAQSAAGVSEELVRKVNSKDRSEVGSNSKLATFATLGLIGAASGSDKTAALAVAGSSAIETAQAQADAMSLYYDEQLKTLKNELLATTNKEKQLEIQEKIVAMTKQQEEGMARINNAVAAQISRQTGYASDIISQNKSKLFIGNNFLNDAARRQDAFFDAQKADVKAKYKGTAQEASAQRVLDLGARADEDKSFANKNEGRTFEAKVNFLMQSGQMQPEQIETMMKIFKGDLKKMDTVLAVGMRLHGGAKMAELAGMLSGVDKKTAKRIILQMSRKNPEEFARVGKAIAVLQRSDGLEVDMQATIDTIGMPGLVELSNKLAALESLPDPIEKEAIIKFGIDNNVDMQGIIDNWDYYSKLKPEVRKEAFETYTTLFTTATSFKTQAEKDAWVKLQAENAAILKGDAGSEAYKTEYQTVIRLLTLDAKGKPLPLNDFKAAAQWANKGVEAIFGSDPTIASNTGENLPGDDAGNKKNPLDFLDSLAMRIKNVRNGAFDATKPLESMLAAFSNPKAKKDMALAFDIFDGLQQKMIGLKVPKEFRDMISSMSSEDFKDLAKLTGKKAIFTFQKDKKGKELPRTKANIKGLTDTGKKLMKTYNEAIVGEANVVNRETVEQVQNQEKAFRILVASGASATEALESVQNAATAAAIASGALGKVGSKERKQYIEDLKKATTETERFALSQKMIRANEEFKLLEQMPKLSTAMKEAGFSSDQMQEVLNDPALARHLIEDLKDGKVEAGEIADFLNSIEAKKILDIQVKFNAGQYSESAKPGMDLVDEMFAVQENLLRTGADPRTTAMVDTMNANNKSIKEAEASAEIFRRQIELINREIEKDQRAIEEKYSRPIDDLSEQVNDLTRDLEMNPIFGDRAIEKLNTENTTLSNDLALISNAAEKINERYDEQAEALQKVSDINAGILSQQKGQLDLADALSKGDISGAAQAMQANRADSAGRLQTSASDALEQARKNEIDGLRGAQSGLSQKQIEDRQFEISQKIYSMETDPARVAILDQIRVKQDEIYRLEELREGALLKIRDKEDKIYEIQSKQLGPLEEKIEKLTYANTLIQAQIDKLVDEQEVLDKTKLEWDRVKAKIEANTLAGKDFDKQLGALLASTDAIDKKWQSILDKLASYSKTPVTVTDAKKSVEDKAAADAKTVAEEKKTITDAAIAAMDKAMIGKDDGNSSSLGFNNGNSFSGDGEKGSTAEQNAKADALANLNNWWSRGERDARGGLIKTKRFAIGGTVIGTDTVPAMLTPGEFVMSRYAVQSTGIDKMKAINNGSSVGDAVYNYNLSVNVKSDANPEDIARVVMTQIKGVDAQRLRGNRL